MSSQKNHRNPVNKKSGDWSGILVKAPYLFFAIIIFAVYAHSISFDLVNCDDYDIIGKDFGRIEHLSSAPSEFLKGYITTNYYRPLTQISFITDAQFDGQSPEIYHVTNIILHIIACCLLYYLLNILGYEKLKSFFATVIFAVHPVFTNDVAWIVGRNDLIASIFCLLSLIALARYLVHPEKIYLVLHFISFLLALFSKEIALVFPLIFIFYIGIYHNEKLVSKRNIFLASGWLIAILIFFGMRSLATLGEQVYRTGFDVFIMNLPTLPEIIGKFFLPVQLSVLPTYNQFHTAIGLFFILALAILVYVNKNKKLRIILFGSVWYLALLLPGLFMTLKNSQDWNEYLDCRSYLPMVGIIIILLELLPNLKNIKFKKNFVSGSIIITLLLSVITVNVSNNYSSMYNFYKNGEETSPDRVTIRYILSLYYEKTEQWDDMKIELLKIIALKPKIPKYNYNLGAYYDRFKNEDLAIKYLNTAISLDSNFKEAYSLLSHIYMKLNMNRETIDLLKIQLAHTGPQYSIFHNLVYTYFKTGEIDSAFLYTDIYLKDNPPSSELTAMYNKWADYYSKLKQPDISERILKKSSSFNPDSAGTLSK